MSGRTNTYVKLSTRWPSSARRSRSTTSLPRPTKKKTDPRLRPRGQLTADPRQPRLRALRRAAAARTATSVLATHARALEAADVYRHEAPPARPRCACGCQNRQPTNRRTMSDDLA